MKSIRYRGMSFKILLVLFVISFVALGRLGMLPATPFLTLLAQIFSVMYFGFFIALFITSRFEKTKPVPERITK